jgi:hypothetical protein
MDEPENQGAEGVEPAAQPAGTAPEKTPEQLAAEKADEAKQKEVDDAEEQAAGKKPWFQKRIDEITRARREAESRADRLERMVGQLVQRGQTPPAEKPAQPEPFQPTKPRPTREQFEFDEDRYIDAVADWRYEQREAQLSHDRKQSAQKTAMGDFENYFETNRAKTMEIGRQMYPDFETVISSVPGDVLTDEMALAIFQTGKPAEIVYHLAKNSTEAARIAKLPPLKKAVELGKIEAAISVRQPRQSQAPPPINPLDGKSPATVSEDDLPYPEWVKLREAGKITGRS